MLSLVTKSFRVYRYFLAGPLVDFFLVFLTEYFRVCHSISSLAPVDPFMIIINKRKQKVEFSKRLAEYLNVKSFGRSLQ